MTGPVSRSTNMGAAAFRVEPFAATASAAPVEAPRADRVAPAAPPLAARVTPALPHEQVALRFAEDLERAGDHFGGLRTVIEMGAATLPLIARLAARLHSLLRSAETLGLGRGGRLDAPAENRIMQAAQNFRSATEGLDLFGASRNTAFERPGQRKPAAEVSYRAAETLKQLSLLLAEHAPKSVESHLAAQRRNGGFSASAERSLGGLIDRGLLAKLPLRLFATDAWRSEDVAHLRAATSGPDGGLDHFMDAFVWPESEGRKLGLHVRLADDAARSLLLDALIDRCRSNYVFDFISSCLDGRQEYFDRARARWDARRDEAR